MHTAFWIKHQQQKRSPMSHETSTDKLVYMANQISKFFASQGEAVAVNGTAEHLKKFWDPRMRASILRHLAAGGHGLDPIARHAVERLQNS
jgi:formate dehydrogenase subunit delta